MTNTSSFKPDEVRGLFPWEKFTKMLWYLLSVEKKPMKLGTNKLKPDFKLLPKISFGATISTKKSTSEIDADLAQNEM